MSSGSTSPATRSTRDKVIRREFRLNEGDAFNALKVKRSQDRIQSLGFFQEKLEIKQTEGSAPDRVVLGVERRGKADRPAVAVGRLFEPRAVRRPARGLAEQFHGQGPAARRRRSTIRAIRSRSQLGFSRPLFPRQADPVRRQHLPARLQQLQLSSATSATRPIRRSAPAAACGSGFPLTEYWSFGSRYTLSQRQDLARQEHLLHRPGRHRAAARRVRSAQGRPLSVRRNRHAADLAGRLFDASTTIPTASARRAASG